MFVNVFPVRLTHLFIAMWFLRFVPRVSLWNKWSSAEVSSWSLPEVDECFKRLPSPTVSPPLCDLAWESYSRTRHRRSSQAPEYSAQWSLREVHYEWSAVGWLWEDNDGALEDWGWVRTRNSVSTRSAYNGRARCGKDSTGGVELLFLLYHTIVSHKLFHLPCLLFIIKKCKFIERWWWYIVRFCLTLSKGN